MTRFKGIETFCVDFNTNILPFSDLTNDPI